MEREKLEAALKSMRVDLANAKAGVFVSSVELNLNDAEFFLSMKNGEVQLEVAKACAVRAAKYLYGILDARYRAVEAL